MSRTYLAAVAAALAIAGLAAGALTGASEAQPTFTREIDRDRSGNDVAVVALDVSAGVAACEALCRARTDCVAFTFVKRSATVPRPVCRLKNERPYPHESSCCVSGERME